MVDILLSPVRNDRDICLRDPTKLCTQTSTGGGDGLGAFGVRPTKRRKEDEDEELILLLELLDSW